MAQIDAAKFEALKAATWQAQLALDQAQRDRDAAIRAVDTATMAAQDAAAAFTRYVAECSGLDTVNLNVARAK